MKWNEERKRTLASFTLSVNPLLWSIGTYLHPNRLDPWLKDFHSDFKRILRYPSRALTRKETSSAIKKRGEEEKRLYPHKLRNEAHPKKENPKTSIICIKMCLLLLTQKLHETFHSHRKRSVLSLIFNI